MRLSDPTADDPIGARGETESSETQVMTYPYCVGILKPSPPTIYRGQGLASDLQAATLAHGECALLLVKTHCDLEKNRPEWHVD